MPADAHQRVPIVVPEITRKADQVVTMSHWLVKVGERVDAGKAVVEITCDKTDVEVFASAGGVLVETLAKFGDEVAAGTEIGWIDPHVTPWETAGPVLPERAVRRCGNCGAPQSFRTSTCHHCGVG